MQRKKRIGPYSKDKARMRQTLSSGFIALPDLPLILFLPLATARSV
jgi:hypothetical protein